MNRYQQMRAAIVAAAPNGVVFHFQTPSIMLNAATSAQEVSALDSLYAQNTELALEAAQRQMDFQTAANQKAMDFSAAREDLAYERFLDYAQNAYVLQVDALKRAGLNPALAYNQQPMSMSVPSSASGVTSSGAKASFNDTGYVPYQLRYAYTQMAVNAATQISKALIDGGFKLAAVGKK